MWTRYHKRRNTGGLIVPAITVVVLSYFAFHAYHGDYGIAAKGRYQQRIETLEGELADIAAARAKLEERVSLLNSSSIEKDMLDEQVRRTLNYAAANELVIYRRPAN